MRFGKCLECNEYKYLIDKSICKSCKEDKENWVVVKNGYNSGDKIDIYKKGLSEDRAKHIARQKTIFTAYKFEDLDNDKELI